MKDCLAFFKEYYERHYGQTKRSDGFFKCLEDKRRYWAPYEFFLSAVGKSTEHSLLLLCYFSHPKRCSLVFLLLLILKDEGNLRKYFYQGGYLTLLSFLISMEKYTNPFNSFIPLVNSSDNKKMISVQANKYFTYLALS